MHDRRPDPFHSLSYMCHWDLLFSRTSDGKIEVVLGESAQLKVVVEWFLHDVTYKYCIEFSLSFLNSIC